MPEAAASLPIKGLVAWVLILSCFLGIPFGLLFLGTKKVLSLYKENQQFLCQMSLQIQIDEILSNTDSKRFLGTKLKKVFQGGERAISPLAYLSRQEEQLNQEWGRYFEFVVWDAAGKPIKIPAQSKFDSQIWGKVYESLKFASQHSAKFLRRNGLKHGAILAKVFGKQIIPKNILQPIHLESEPIIISTELNHPLFWWWVGPKFSLGAFIHPDALNEFGGIKELIRQKNSKFDEFSTSLGMLKEIGSHTEILLSSTLAHQELLSAFDKYRENFTSIIETSDHFFVFRYLSDNIRLFAEQKKGKILFFYPFLPTIIFLLALFSSFPILPWSFRVIVQGKEFYTPVRSKLAILFFFANGLPLLVLGFLGYDFLSQKQMALINEAHRTGAKLLQNFDSSVESSYGRLRKSVMGNLDLLVPVLKKKGMSFEVSGILQKNFYKFSPNNLIFVASQSDVLINQRGIFGKGDGKNKFSMISKKDKLARQIVQLIIERFNGSVSTKQEFNQLEIAAEGAMQQSIDESMNLVIDSSERVFLWGFGVKKRPSFMKFIKLFSPDKVDYGFIIDWSSGDLQQRYIEEAIISANRNIQGFHLFAFSEENQKIIFPPETNLSAEITDFVKKLGSAPAFAPGILKNFKSDVLAIGFQGKYLENFRLLALYPYEKIETVLDSQKNRLLSFGLLSLVLTGFLSNLLGKRFLSRVQILTRGALAMEQKEFEHRLPSLGNDEFGEMSEIFNRVMVSLEDLQVARIIQENFFPTDQIPTKNFRLYGKSIAMSELGGDYFDYFTGNEPCFCALIGDVAGHGVPSAMIMALAKAGIVGLEHYLDKPSELLNHLHTLIYTARKKRHTFMTFQYLYANGETGETRLANAGHCSPLFIENSGFSPQFIHIQGDPLGSRKTVRISERELNFKHGDALIFYTDGIIEGANTEGKELGYEGFSKLACKSWNEDPKIYYENIYNGYLKYRGSNEAKDDLTLIILIFIRN